MPVDGNRKWMMQMERWPDGPPFKKDAALAGLPSNATGFEGRPRPISQGGRALRIPLKGGGGGKTHYRRKVFRQKPGVVVSNGIIMKEGQKA